MYVHYCRTYEKVVRGDGGEGVLLSTGGSVDTLMLYSTQHSVLEKQSNTFRPQPFTCASTRHDLLDLQVAHP